MLLKLSSHLTTHACITIASAEMKASSHENKSLSSTSIFVYRIDKDLCSL
jgi:hypothetical protein